MAIKKWIHPRRVPLTFNSWTTWIPYPRSGSIDLTRPKQFVSSTGAHGYGENNLVQSGPVANMKSDMSEKIIVLRL